MRKISMGMLSLIVFLMFVISLLAAPVGTSDQQVKAISEPILDNLLAGFNQGNYAQYSKDFDDTLREAIPEKKSSRCGRTSLKSWANIRTKNTWAF